MRLYGRDVLTDMELRGISHSCTEPRSRHATHRLVGENPRQFARRHRAGIYYHTPENPALALRKLARNFVILEGAYLLMAEDVFTTFRTDDVFAKLQALFPAWKPLYLITAEILRDPYRAWVGYTTYLQQITEYLAFTVRHLQEISGAMELVTQG